MGWIKKVRKILGFVTNLRLLKVFYSMSYKGYLMNEGWIHSFNKKIPVSQDGAPLPWVTLSFIGFIKKRLSNRLTVLEYGSGNSTLFYAMRVQRVISVESNETWYEKIKSQMPSNVSLTYIQDRERYVKFAQEAQQTFDVIIVDGHSRLECVKASCSTLSEGGVIVLDNSNRQEYGVIFSFMEQNGFKPLDFWGMAPGSIRTNCTTVFYKNNNCLNI